MARQQEAKLVVKTRLGFGISGLGFRVGCQHDGPFRVPQILLAEL